MNTCFFFNFYNGSLACTDISFVHTEMHLILVCIIDRSGIDPGLSLGRGELHLITIGGVHPIKNNDTKGFRK